MAAHRMKAIEVSHEMLAFVGRGDLSPLPWPDAAVALIFDVSGSREPPTLRFDADPRSVQLGAGAELDRIIFIVSRDACERLRGKGLGLTDGQNYLLTGELHAIALAIRDCKLPDAAAIPYRLAKSIELLCEVIEADRNGALVPVLGGVSTLSFSDRSRVAKAWAMIEQRWNEPLTLDGIARHCGINRSKLSRGFRELYGISVAEAVSERRLDQARRELLATDLPVGLIGYRSGYQNNASFTRAFGRRFGVSPTELRSGTCH
jgi:AraC family transcriptional activator of pyochelin receptor